MAQSSPKILPVAAAGSHQRNSWSHEQVSCEVRDQADRSAGVQSLIDELEAATHEASQERRVQMLRRITDLLVGTAGTLTAERSEVFGEVLRHLIEQVESETLAELGARLAPLENAPNAVMQRLARNDEIAVAGPVLARSIKLSNEDLIEIAETKSQEHLGAISDRQRIDTSVTDVLVRRGDGNVVRKLSRNRGAAFSATGFHRLADRAGTDEYLAENLAERMDLPSGLLQKLVSQATEAVRERLLASAPPDSQYLIETALAGASDRVMRHSVTKRDFSRAESKIAAMAKAGTLNESTIQEFANEQQYEEMVAGLARLCSAPIKLIDQLMNQVRHDGILVACKAASIHWPVCSAILMNRFPRHQPCTDEVVRACLEFLKLTAATAQRAFRFWIIRGVADAQMADGEQTH